MAAGRIRRSARLAVTCRPPTTFASATRSGCGSAPRRRRRHLRRRADAAVAAAPRRARRLKIVSSSAFLQRALLVGDEPDGGGTPRGEGTAERQASALALAADLDAARRRRILMTTPRSSPITCGGWERRRARCGATPTPKPSSEGASGARGACARGRPPVERQCSRVNPISCDEEHHHGTQGERVAWVGSHGAVLAALSARSQ